MRQYRIFTNVLITGLTCAFLWGSFYLFKHPPLIEQGASNECEFYAELTFAAPIAIVVLSLLCILVGLQKKANIKLYVVILLIVPAMFIARHYAIRSVWPTEVAGMEQVQEEEEEEEEVEEEPRYIDGIESIKD